MTEEWRDVPGYEGRYQVSDMGAVRSLRCRWGPRVTPRTLRIMTRQDGEHLTVSLRPDSTRPAYQERRAVHRLVLLAFVGPCPDGMEGLHWDDDPTNNALSNLRWGTHAENMADASRNGRFPKGERHSKAVLSESLVRHIRDARAGGETKKSIAVRLGIGETTVWKVLARKTWKEVL